MAQTALWIFFIGEGIAIAFPYLVGRSSPSLPDWFQRFYSLLVALPAVVLGIRPFLSYRGIAKAAPIIACLLWMGVSLTWTDPTEVGRGMLVYASVLIILPLTALIVQCRCIEQGCLWFGAAFVGSLIVSILSGMESLGDRLGDLVDEDTTVMNSNSLGCGAVLVLLLVYRLYEQRRSALAERTELPMPIYAVALPAVALAALGLCLLSASRTAVAILAVGTALSLLWHIGCGSRIAIRISTVVALLVPALYWLGWFQRALERFGDEDLGSLNGRTDIWQSGWNFVWNSGISPVWGCGLGGVNKLLARAFGWGVEHPVDGILRLHSHNQYLEWILELGTVGGALGLWLVLTLLRQAWRQDRADHVLHRRLLMLFFLSFGMAGVIYKSETWLAVGPLMLAFLTPRITTGEDGK